MIDTYDSSRNGLLLLLSPILNFYSSLSFQISALETAYIPVEYMADCFHSFHRMKFENNDNIIIL